MRPGNTLVPGLIIIGAMLVGVLVVALYVWPKDSDFVIHETVIHKPKANTKAVNGNTNTTNGNANTTADATAGWQTYTNSQFGFSFKYPSNGTVEKSQEKIIDAFTITQDSTLYNLVITSATNPAVSNKVSSPECYTEKEKKTLNGNTWSVNSFLCGIGADTDANYVYSITHNSKVFEFSYNKASTAALLEQILATFSFTQ